ncbi:MAG: hypothetical protein R2939_07550 [Kofleriaceae bacterium]
MTGAVPTVGRAATGAAPTVGRAATGVVSARTSTGAEAAAKAPGPAVARTATEGSRLMIARTATFEGRLADAPAGELDLPGPGGLELDLEASDASNFPRSRPRSSR